MAIIACSCTSTFQDARYGKGMRVHNYARKAQTNGAWRCAVCGSLKPREAHEVPFADVSVRGAARQ